MVISDAFGGGPMPFAFMWSSGTGSPPPPVVVVVVVVIVFWRFGSPFYTQNKRNKRRVVFVCVFRFVFFTPFGVLKGTLFGGIFFFSSLKKMHPFFPFFTQNFTKKKNQKKKEEKKKNGRILSAFLLLVHTNLKRIQKRHHERRRRRDRTTTTTRRRRRVVVGGCTEETAQRVRSGRPRTARKSRARWRGLSRDASRFFGG